MFLIFLSLASLNSLSISFSLSLSPSHFSLTCLQTVLSNSILQMCILTPQGPRLFSQPQQLYHRNHIHHFHSSSSSVHLYCIYRAWTPIRDLLISQTFSCTLCVHMFSVEVYNQTQPRRPIRGLKTWQWDNQTQPRRPITGLEMCDWLTDWLTYIHTVHL